MAQVSKPDKWQKHWRIFSVQLRFFIIVILILGIFFSFSNIDKKFYWEDETWTSLRISGYTHGELIGQAFNGRLISVGEIRKYQVPNPEKKLADTINSLAQEEPQLSPLYFSLVRLWAEWFGGSVGSIRSLSVFISLLAFPCLYWLCLELFASPLVGWVALALLAISPFHVLYAQEARMYSLWTVQILLSSAAILWAIRRNTKSNWGIYSATIALGLYTNILSALVTFGQGIYLLTLDRFRASRKIAHYLISCLLAVLLFIPWLWMLIHNSSGAETALSWLQGRAGIIAALTSFFNNICHAFIDFWFVYTYFPGLDIPNFRFGKYLKPLLIVLIVYSLYFLCRKTPLRVWLFVTILIPITPLFLIIRDLRYGSISLGLARYIIPSYLGIQLSLAYLLATQISNPQIKFWQKNAWKLVTILLISGGILSCAISSQAETWSNKYGYNQFSVARFVNQKTRPLIVSDTKPTTVLSLSHYLNPEVKLQLATPHNTPQISRDFDNIFLFEPSSELRKSIAEEQNFKLVRVKKIRGLWQLERG